MNKQSKNKTENVSSGIAREEAIKKGESMQYLLLSEPLCNPNGGSDMGSNNPPPPPGWDD